MLLPFHMEHWWYFVTYCYLLTEYLLYLNLGSCCPEHLSTQYYYNIKGWMRHKVEFTTKTLKSDNISCHVIHHHQNNILITWADTPNGQTAPLGRHPPSRHPRQTTLQADIPLGQIPQQTPPLCSHPPGQTPPDRHPPQTVTAADGTHPTWMLSC